MRVCPVCNETFADDLKFCDLDGTPLKGTGAGTSSSGRLWSLLGIALLVGALAISAAMIVFQPRGPVAQGPRPQPAETTTQRPAPSAEVDRAVPSPELTATAPGSQIDPGSQKVRPAASQLPAGPLPDPKAAAIAAEAATEKPGGEAKPASNNITSGSERPVTTLATESGGGKERLAPSDASTVTPAATEPKKDPKARSPKESGQDTPKGDDKKKGGFLKVFKKIFGNK